MRFKETQAYGFVRGSSVISMLICGLPVFSFKPWSEYREDYMAVESFLREMNMNIYVGNFPYRTSEEELRTMFEEYGEVDSVRIIMERETGRSKGFGFVEMTADSDAQDAIKALNETDLGGRQIKVNEARPKTERRDRRPSRKSNYDFY